MKTCVVAKGAKAFELATTTYSKIIEDQRVECIAVPCNCLRKSKNLMQHHRKINVNMFLVLTYGYKAETAYSLIFD